LKPRISWCPWIEDAERDVLGKFGVVWDRIRGGFERINSGKRDMRKWENG
jgi:hypothetical protein